MTPARLRVHLATFISSGFSPRLHARGDLMTASRQQAVANAMKVQAYDVGMCARFTREQYGLGALGDHDGDGDADAVDMWKASRLKNPGDLNPPAGVPVFWGGGSAGHGHAAVSLGNGLIRTIDRPASGLVSSVPLSEIERAWGLKYLGWTIDLYGHEIPDAEAVALQERIDRKRARRGDLKGQLKRLRDRLRRLKA